MNKLKIKDIVMIALLSALYLIFYMISGTVVMVFGAFGHAISPGVCAIFTGTVMYFMTKKVGKFGQFLIMQAICMVLFSIMGAGYIPWYITSMIGALVADLIASRSNKPAVWKVAVASGVFHVGQAFGSIIPSMFFMESYREEWIARGQTPEAMDEMISYTTGAMGVLATAIVFVLAVAGVYIGYLILRKHFERKEAAEA
ncbi:MAG: MptD family putative ECF transporter S component [Lachnospiraceae bacterium]|nr:MptD family putative ECF transporter S component [Lachnospiraceae bacterium]